MNIRWSKLLYILRQVRVPFTTSIEGDNIETIYIRGEYMESCQWNKLSTIDQHNFLDRIGIRYERPQHSSWKRKPGYRKAGNR